MDGRQTFELVLILGLILIIGGTLNYFASKMFEAAIGGVFVVIKRWFDRYRRERSLRKLPPEIPPPPQ